MTQATPSTPGPSWPRAARIRGLVIGAAIGGTLFVFGLFPSSGDGPGIPIGPGALLAGTIGGWLFAPAAIRASSKKRIALVLCGYAALATVIGDVVASAQIVYRTIPGGFAIERAVDGIGDTFSLAEFGILIMGALFFPLALGAAMLWRVLLTEFPPSVGAKAESRDIPER
ncbi:MAG TPA: hypothetical protein VFI15_05990 [Candidatus Limnocylindrales bacterium]|nr:hypothetical protein [Candidatus Limnocylindrales bacterium]